LGQPSPRPGSLRTRHRRGGRRLQRAHLRSSTTLLDAAIWLRRLQQGGVDDVGHLLALLHGQQVLERGLLRLLVRCQRDHLLKTARGGGRRVSGSARQRTGLHGRSRGRRAAWVWRVLPGPGQRGQRAQRAQRVQVLFYP
jgi:hypothetical protein